jgi:hypothetical protein
MPTVGLWSGHLTTATGIVALGASFEMTAGAEYQTDDWSWAWYNLGSAYDFWWDYQKNGAPGGAGVFVLQHCL